MLSVDVQFLRLLCSVSVQLSIGVGFLRVVEASVSATPYDEERDDCDDRDSDEASDNDGYKRRALTAVRDALDGAVIARLVCADDG